MNLTSSNLMWDCSHHIENGIKSSEEANTKKKRMQEIDWIKTQWCFIGKNDFGFSSASLLSSVFSFGEAKRVLGIRAYVVYSMCSCANCIDEANQMTSDFNCSPCHDNKEQHEWSKDICDFYHFVNTFLLPYLPLSSVNELLDWWSFLPWYAMQSTHLAFAFE